MAKNTVKRSAMLNKPRLLTPGPTPIPEDVRLALAADMIHHRKPEFKKIMASVEEKLQLLFGTGEAVIPLASSGTGAMVAAVRGLFAPGERVLVIEGGKFAERWAEIAAAHGLTVSILKVEPGKAVDPAALKGVIAEFPDVRGVLVQLCETSTGAQHPVKELAAITSASDALLVVDGISGVGICPCPMDAWGIDCLLTGSQKGLMLPPGLSFIALSARAWRKAEALPARDFYFNLPAERAAVGKGQTNFTPAIGLLMGLETSLGMFFEAGLQNIYCKQWALSVMARTGVKALGLDLFAPEAPAWGLTSVKMPEGISSSELLAHAAARYNVVMAAGQGEFKNRVVRIGHMGWVDWADLAAGLYALAGSFTAMGGHSGTRDYLEQALAAYWQALDNGYPDM